MWHVPRYARNNFQNAMEIESSEKYLCIYSYRCLSCSVVELVSGKLYFFILVFKPHHCDTDNHFYFYWCRSAHHIYTYLHIHYYTCLTRIRVVWWGLPCGGRQHFDRRPKERISVLVYTHWNITANCVCLCI